MRADRERASVEAFYALLGAALVAFVATEAASGVWDVHAGRLFPWRHVWPFPLYGVGLLALEWTLLGASGVALAVGRGRRIASRVALFAAGAGLTQRFSNARSLAFLVLLFVALDPPDPRAAGFTSGASLANLVGCSAGVARGLSIATVALELALPFALVLRPAIGIAGVVLLHVAFATVVPGLWPFTLLMTAMSALYTDHGDGSRVIGTRIPAAARGPRPYSSANMNTRGQTHAAIPRSGSKSDVTGHLDARGQARA